MLSLNSSSSLSDVLSSVVYIILLYSFGLVQISGTFACLRDEEKCCGSTLPPTATPTVAPSVCPDELQTYTGCSETKMSEEERTSCNNCANTANLMNQECSEANAKLCEGLEDTCAKFCSNCRAELSEYINCQLDVASNGSCKLGCLITEAPSVSPTFEPTTSAPTALPTLAPTARPTAKATTPAPTPKPVATDVPTLRGTTTAPTRAPTKHPTPPPTTNKPTKLPTLQPITPKPTKSVTREPTKYVSPQLCKWSNQTAMILHFHCFLFLSFSKSTNYSAVSPSRTNSRHTDRGLHSTIWSSAYLLRRANGRSQLE